jgi:hypothetical protein
MKKLLPYSLFSVVLVVAALLFSEVGKGDDDLNHCLVKYKSEWSKECSQCLDFSNSYRAYFRNDCTKKIDVKVAAQEVDKRWKTFVRLEMNPKDTVVAYACKGTGKYLYWVRESGDNTVVFLTDDEINEQFFSK